MAVPARRLVSRRLRRSLAQSQHTSRAWAHHEDAGEGGSPIGERAEVPSVPASMDQQDQADEEDSARLLIAQPLPQHRALSRRLLMKTVDLPHRFLASASAETRHSLQHVIPRPPACSGTDVFVTLTDIRAFLACDAKVGSTAAKGWHEILSLAYPEWADEPLEQILLFLVLRCKTYRRTNPETSLQMIEYWAGTGNLTQQHINLGIRSSRFDTKYSEQHDCTSPMGLRLWLEELCRTAELSLVGNDLLFVCGTLSRAVAEKGIQWVSGQRDTSFGPSGQSADARGKSVVFS